MGVRCIKVLYSFTHSLTPFTHSPIHSLSLSLSASAESMECDGGNAVAPASPAAETSVSDALIFVSAQKQDFLFAQVWKDRLRQRVRPEEKPPRNPWSTLDPHSLMKGAKPYRKGQYLK